MNRCWSSGRVPYFALGLSFCIAVASSALAQEKKLDADVEKLLRERFSILQDVAKVQRDQFVAGRGSLAVILAAERSVAEAELELATSTAERIKARENLLKNAVELEKSTDARAKAGLIPSLDRLIAKAARLRAEADLLMERKAAK